MAHAPYAWNLVKRRFSARVRACQGDHAGERRRTLPEKPSMHDHRRSAAMIILAMAAATAGAADPKPEIEREPGAPQAVGAAHTLRTIPEACARIEGVFTGQAADPYRFSVVRTSANCQARARLVDAKKANATADQGWIFHDLVRVPSAACPSQQAVVRIWRKPADATPPALDAQGRSRIYLKDAKAKLQAQGADLPLYAAAMAVEGQACSG
jgi:hypothetical protein